MLPRIRCVVVLGNRCVSKSGKVLSDVHLMDYSNKCQIYICCYILGSASNSVTSGKSVILLCLNDT